MRQAGVKRYRRSVCKQPASGRPLLATALLLALFLHPQAWNSWALMLRAKIRYEARERIEAGLEQEETVTTIIKIPLSWIKNGHPHLVWTEADEFRYLGEMYDILSQEQCGDSIWYSCYHDKAETALLKEVFEKMQARRDPLSTTGMRLAFAVIFEKWQLHDEALPDLTFIEPRHPRHCGIQHLAGRICDEPASPPPQFSISFL